MIPDDIPKYVITDRLLLRPWESTDMYSLYENARDEEVARSAGWLRHISPETSLGVIENTLNKPGTYAIVPKSVGRAVGSISLMFKREANMSLEDNEAELGYWIGKSYWGNGYVPEAAKELIRIALDDLKLKRVWCCCTTDNVKSMRVQEKCGFRYVRTGIKNDPIYGEREMRYTYIER